MKAAPATPVETLLLVDDNPDNLTVMKMVLKKALPSAEIVTMQKPEEVMDYVRSANISVAIFDVQMPVLNGIELCRLIKTSDETRHIPVILVTSHEASSGTKTTGLAVGADDFLNRPIDNEELVARVKVALRISRAEARLRREADRVQQDYQLLFDKMLSGFAVHEMIFDGKGNPVDYRFLSVNPAFEALLNLRAEEVLGKTGGEIFPGLEPQWLERYGQVVATGEPVHFEDYAAVLDRYFDVTAFRTGENQFATSFTDITKRKLAEFSLAESEKKSRAWLANSPVCTKILDLDFNLQYMSESGVADLKVDDVTQLYGKPYPFSFYPDSFKKQMIGNLEKAKATGETITQEAAVVDLEGNELWYHSTIVPAKDEQNQLEYLLVISMETTARHRAEASLQASEKAFRGLFEGSRDAIMTLAPPGWQFTSGNPATVKMFGAKSEEEFISWGPWELSPERQPDGRASAEKAMEMIETALREGSHLFEWTHRQIGGKEFPTDVLLTRMEQAGKVLIQATVRDITERKQAEEALKRARDDAQQYLDVASVMLVALNVDGRITLINRKGCDILGYANADELLGRNWFETCLPARLTDDVTTVFNGLMRGDIESVEYYDNPVVTKTGVERMVAFHNTVIRDSMLRITGILSSGEDITKRKQAEEELRGSEERFNVAADAATIGVWEFDIFRDQLVWDNRMFHLYGIRPDEFTGVYEAWCNGLHPEDRQRAMDEVTAATSGQKPFDTEFRIIRPDGSIRYLRAFGKVIRAKDGTPLRMIGTNQDITERKQAEEALRESEMLQHKLLAQLPVGVIIVDALTHTIERVNERAEAMFGGSAEQMIGRRCHSFLCPAEENACPILDLGQDVDKSERVMILADGRRSPVLKSVTRIQIGGREKLLECFVDLTERKRAEEKLKKTEAKQAKMVANIGDVIVIIDQNGINRYKSPNITKWFGWRPEEVVGCGALDNVHPDDMDRAREFIGDLMSTPNKTGTIECQYRCKDGTYKWIEFTGINLLQDAEVQGILGNYHDITERKKAEEVILRERDFSQTALDSLPGLFYMFDEQGQFVRLNKNFEHISGYSTEELSHMTIRDLFDETVWPRVAREIQRVYQAGESTVEADFLSKNQTRTPCFFTGKRFQFAEKSCLLGMGIDITKRKQAEAERETLQAQLTQSQKMEAVGQLAGGIAHDFNNVLQAILGYCALLLRKLKKDTEEYQDVSAIKQSSIYASDIIRQLMNFSRKQPSEKNPTQINTVITNTSGMLKMLLDRKITSVFDLAEDLPPVLANAGQLSQIIINLAVNARDAMPEGGRLTFRTEKIMLNSSDTEGLPGSRSGEFVCLSVIDTGCGMTPEVQRRIFEPFFTSKEVGKGTGMGLSVLYGIVQQHQGWIHVHSEAGQGSTFNIYLPVHEADDPAATRPAPAAGAKHEHILLVETDPDVRKRVVQLLEAAEYRVSAAESAEEALALFEARPEAFDLLVSDIVLKARSGINLANELRLKNPALPVLLCGNDLDSLKLRDDFGSKGYHFLQKPITATPLMIAVCEAIGFSTTSTKTEQSTRMENNDGNEQ